MWLKIWNKIILIKDYEEIIDFGFLWRKFNLKKDFAYICLLIFSTIFIALRLQLPPRSPGNIFFLKLSFLRLLWPNCHCSWLGVKVSCVWSSVPFTSNYWLAKTLLKLRFQSVVDIARAERLKDPDWELRSSILGSIHGHEAIFQSLIAKIISKAPSVKIIGIIPSLWRDSYKGVDCALTLDEPVLYNGINTV